MRHYKSDFWWIADNNCQKQAYILPDDVDVKTAITDLVMEYLAKLGDLKCRIDRRYIKMIVKNSAFVSGPIYQRLGRDYYKIVENPYFGLSNTELTKIVNDFIDKQKAIKKLASSLEEIAPIADLF